MSWSTGQHARSPSSSATHLPSPSMASHPNSPHFTPHHPSPSVSPHPPSETPSSIIPQHSKLDMVHQKKSPNSNPTPIIKEGRLVMAPASSYVDPRHLLFTRENELISLQIRLERVRQHNQRMNLHLSELASPSPSPSLG
jgi:hypothetical protein